jgi:lauroyl/myristoyl acyltransferase
VFFPVRLLSALFAPFFALSGVRRAVLDRNIALLGRSPSFPRAARSPFFRLKLGFNLSRDLLTFLFCRFRAPKMTPRSRRHLQALRSGPSLLLCAHFHNWERQAASLRAAGVNLLGAARPLRARWADALLRGVRRRHGIAVATAAVPRASLRHLRAGGCFGLLWDQHAPGSPHEGRLFGVPATLDPLPFFLLERNPAPVFFGALLPGGESRLIPLLTRFDGDWRRRLERRYHRVLEILIRRHPARWYGFLHARFKVLGAYPGHRRNGQ